MSLFGSPFSPLPPVQSPFFVWFVAQALTAETRRAQRGEAVLPKRHRGQGEERESRSLCTQCLCGGARDGPAVLAHRRGGSLRGSASGSPSLSVPSVSSVVVLPGFQV